MSHPAPPRLPPPSSAELAWLCDRLAPGGRARVVRRLRGGIDAVTHAIDIEPPAGARQRLVLRRMTRTTRDVVARIERLWRILAALEKLDLPAPRPVWLDATGEVFGLPALVMTRMPGHGLLAPRDLAAWTGDLARALAALHGADVQAVDEDSLRDAAAVPFWGLLVIEAQREAIATHPRGSEVLAQVHRWRAHAEASMAATLIHGDYWAGNTLWRRGRLTAIVDWDDGRRYQPGYDVGYCRSDLAMLIGSDAPNLFLHAYEAAAGQPVSHLFVWDLLGAVPALPDPAKWLPGYHDLGRRDLTPDLMRARLCAFIDDALARARAAG